MSLKTIVKVGNISNLGEARYCAGMGVEMLGFCLDKQSPNFVDQKKFEGIVQWVEGIKIVGEFSQIPEQDFSEYHLDYIEIQNVEHIKHFSKSQIPLILALNVDYSLSKFANIFEKYRHHISYFLLKTNQLLPPFFLEELRNFASHYPILFDYHTQNQSIEQILETGVKGIALQGSEEISVGINDFEELELIFEQLKN
ncbi:MAG: hypothetical protein EAZ97_11635 [Bacteroidetes bacterium]|nr:MAG: hypothetical protein EAZ97_11635 [Bacteroidota bacterium]